MDFAELQHLAQKVSNGLACFTVSWDESGAYKITMDGVYFLIHRIFGEPEHIALFLETHGNATTDVFQGETITETDYSALVEPPADAPVREWFAVFGQTWGYYLQPHPGNQCICRRPNDINTKAFHARIHTAALLATVATKKETK